MVSNLIFLVLGLILVTNYHAVSALFGKGDTRTCFCGILHPGSGTDLYNPGSEGWTDGNCRGWPTCSCKRIKERCPGKCDHKTLDYITNENGLAKICETHHFISQSIQQHSTAIHDKCVQLSYRNHHTSSGCSGGKAWGLTQGTLCCGSALVTTGPGSFDLITGQFTDCNNPTTLRTSSGQEFQVHPLFKVTTCKNLS